MALVQLNKINALQFFRLLRYGVVILISIGLTKSELSTTEISNYEWLLYLGMALSFFWVNGFVDALLPVYPKLSNEEQPVFLFNVFLQFCLFSLFIVGLLVLGGTWLVPALTGQDQLPYFEAYCWFLGFNLPTVLMEYFYLLKNDPRSILGFGVISFGLQLLAVLFPVFYGWGLEGSIWTLAALGGARFIWLLIWMIKNGQWTINFSILRPYLWLSLPLIAYAFVGGFAGLFDAWLVGWYYQDVPDTFAIFRYGARELPLALALVGGIYTAMVPEVARNIDEALPALKAASQRIYHWLFPISILLLLISEYWFTLVFNPDFISRASIVNIYLLIMVSRVLLPYTIVMGLKESKVIFVVSLLEVGINVILSFIFVQFWGLEGVAWATVIAFLFEKVALAIFLRLKYQISLHRYTDIPWLTFYMILILLAYFYTVL